MKYPIGSYYTSMARERFEQATAFFLKRDFKQAIDNFSQCVKEGTYEVEALGNIGVCYEELHDIPKAFSIYQQGSIKYPQAFATHLKNLLQKTLPLPTLFEAILFTFPSCWTTQSTASSLLITVVMYSKDPALFQLLKHSCQNELRLQPNHPTTLLHMGYLYYLADEPSQALRYLFHIANPPLEVQHIVLLCKLKLSEYTSTFLEDTLRFQEKCSSPWLQYSKDLLGCFYNVNCRSEAKQHWLEYNTLLAGSRKIKVDWENPYRLQNDKDTYCIELENVNLHKYVLFDNECVYAGEKAYTKCSFDKLSTECERIDKPVFSMFHTNIDNYYHWVAECLARYMDFLHIHPDRNDIHILIPKICPSFVVESLAFFGIEPERILKLASKPYCFSKLYTIDYKETGLEKNDVFHVYSPSKRSLQLLSTHLCLTRQPTERKGRKIIYVRRPKGIRSVKNDQYLIDSLTKTYGDTFVTFTSGSFSDQAELFSNASIVFGPHGAGLTNMVFCPKDAHIIEFPLMPNCNRCFEYMANALSLQYSTIPELHSYYYESYNPSTEVLNVAISRIQSICPN